MIVWFIPVVVICVYAAVTDARHRTIPNRVPCVLLLAAAGRMLTGEVSPLVSLLGLIACGVPLLAAACLTDGIGGGDVKMMGAAGAVLGLPTALYALMLGLLLAVVIGGGFQVIRRKEPQPIPMATFLGSATIFLYAITEGIPVWFIPI